MTTSIGQVLAAQYTAGLQAATRRLAEESEERYIASARKVLRPFEKAPSETSLAYTTRAMRLPIPTESMSEVAKAFFILERRNSELRVAVEDGKRDLLHVQEEAADDVVLLNEKDETVTNQETQLRKLKRQVRVLKYMLMLLCFLCLSGGLLGKAEETVLSSPIHICRAVGLYVVCSVVSYLVALAPVWQASEHVSDDTSKPAHEIAVPPTERIRKFYEKHCPEKLNDPDFVARIAERYSYPGGYDALFSTLNKKYN